MTHGHRGKAAARARRWCTLAAADLAFFAILNQSSAPNVALAQIRSHFGTSDIDVSWVVNSYSLSFGSALLVLGVLCDRVGARRMFLAGSFLLLIGSAASFVVPSMPMLVVAQAVIGFGAASLIPASMAFIKDVCPDTTTRTRALSAWAATGAVAVALGPVIGGASVAQFGWRGVFLLGGFVAAVLLLIGAIGVDDVIVDGTTGADPVGEGLVAVALLTSLTVVMLLPSGVSPVVLICGAVAVTTAALAGMRHARRPLLLAELVRVPTVGAVAVLGLLLNFAYYGSVFVLSLHFTASAGYGPLQVGVALLPVTSTLFLSNLVVGRIIGVVGARRLLATGSGLAALGFCGLAAAGSTSRLTLTLLLLLVGTGCGLVVPSMIAVMLHVAPPHQVGASSGLLNTSRQVGSALGVAVFSFFGDVRATQLISGVLLLLISLLSVRLDRRVDTM